MNVVTPELATEAVWNYLSVEGQPIAVDALGLAAPLDDDENEALRRVIRALSAHAGEFRLSEAVMYGADWREIAKRLMSQTVRKAGA